MIKHEISVRGNNDELLDIAFHASPCLMAISTIEDGCYIKVNKCFEETTGYLPEEVIGKTSVELQIFDSTTRRRLAELLENETPVRNVTVRFRTKDGSFRIGLFSAEVIPYNGCKCILSTANDITELKNLEEQLSQLERVNVIGQIASSIAHEVRNPLTSVRGFLQMYSTQDYFRSYFDNFELMIEELDRANQIISEFLSLRRKESVIVKKNINTIIKKLEPLIVTDGLMLNGNVRFDLGDVSDLCINEGEIRQLILNITRNAFESMPEGGQVAIKTYAEESNIVLSVKDQGTGIDESYLQKVGTPFFTTKEKGTGLGLAVSYELAMKNNGMINIKSDKTGTEVTVSFKKHEYVKHGY